MLKIKYKLLLNVVVLATVILIWNSKQDFSRQTFKANGDGVSKIYVTGDIHGLLDIDRILNINNLDEDDYLIILGDFGLLWDNGRKEKKALKKLNSKPFTTLFIEGNHENFDILNALPVESWNGGRIHKVKEKVIHLMRGEIFTLNNKKFFVFGGGTSIDKELRKEHVSWWKEELPSQAEIDNGIKNLYKHNYKVDYVLTHTADAANLQTIGDLMGFSPSEDSCNKFFSQIKSKLTYDKWYFGHFHLDWNINERDRVVLENILEVGQ